MSHTPSTSSSQAITTASAAGVEYGFHSQVQLNVKNLSKVELKVEDLQKIMKDANFPVETNYLLPDKEAYADWSRDGWVCLYTYPFEIGHTLPFSHLVCSFLVTFGFAPSQVMPQAWRILRCFDVLSAEHHIPFQLADLMFQYRVEHLGSSRITLKLKDEMEPAILHTSTNDGLSGWAQRFFFVEIASLGPECKAPFIDKWKTTNSEFLSSLFSLYILVLYTQCYALL